MFWCHELSLQRIDFYVSELATGQSARRVGVVTRTVITVKLQSWPAVNLGFSFLNVSLLQTLNLLYSFRQLAVRIVVSDIAVVTLVDNLLSSRSQIVHWPNYKLDSLATSIRDAGTILCISARAWSRAIRTLSANEVDKCYDICW